MNLNTCICINAYQKAPASGASFFGFLLIVDDKIFNLF